MIVARAAFPLAIGYIELVRGVPPITGCSSRPSCSPCPAGGWGRSVLARRDGLVLFQAAYMAETVRGGL
jgi:ABC-type amino acid transport system permease subunit